MCRIPSWILPCLFRLPKVHRFRTSLHRRWSLALPSILSCFPWVRLQLTWKKKVDWHPVCCQLMLFALSKINADPIVIKSLRASCSPKHEVARSFSMQIVLFWVHPMLFPEEMTVMSPRCLAVKRNHYKLNENNFKKFREKGSTEWKMCLSYATACSVTRDFSVEAYVKLQF